MSSVFWPCALLWSSSRVWYTSLKKQTDYRNEVSTKNKNMNLPENFQPAASIRRQTSRVPKVGELVQVRSRRWLVDEVIEPKSLGQTCVVRLSCADDDAQGQSLEVLWDYELDRLILEEEAWADLAAKGFDPPHQFAAFLHTLRWNCVTATDPNLFQSPFRAGIKIDAYQMEPLRKALLFCSATGSG